jgi:uncharacterized damage-inducible protein DinB
LNYENYGEGNNFIKNGIMKELFVRMLRYDYNTNLLMLHTMMNAGNNKQAIALLAHVMGAQQVWLHRCKKEPAIGGSIWPDWDLEKIALTLEENFVQWKLFVESLKVEDFNTMINYQNSRGESFSNRLSDILAHLMNHGTHHRAQIGQLLKFDGLQKLPITDYIFYIRENDI